MTAAVPNYLKNHLGEAAPGHHFGLYYAGWNDDFSKPKSGVTAALKATVCKLPEHSRQLLTHLAARQQALATGESRLFSWPAIASSPFATGLGNEHPLENGFAFLSPYGLPYLPGSGIKGVIRRAAEELASGDWGNNEEETASWTQAAITNLFGPGENDPERDKNPRQGALRFWDVFPQPAASLKNDRPLLGVEIMTPHLGEYYQGNKTPNTSLTPVPIPFLAVVAGSRFNFHVTCYPGLILPELENIWPALLEAAFTHAGEWLGFGAKTAVGYGRMHKDEKAEAEQHQRREEQKKKEQAEHAQQEEEKRLAEMTPFERSLAEIIKAKPAEQSELKALFNALKANRWQAEDEHAVATRLKTMMQASGQWREKSEKKKPEKDEPYQMTLFIKTRLTP